MREKNMYLFLLSMTILTNVYATGTVPNEAKSQMLYIHTSKNTNNIQDIFRVYNSLDNVIMADKCIMNASDEQIICSPMKEWRNLCPDQLEKYTNENALKDLIMDEMNNKNASSADKTKMILGLISIFVVFGIIVSLTTFTYLVAVIGSIGLLIQMTFFTPSDLQLKNQTEDAVRYLERYSNDTTVINSKYFDFGTEIFILKANETLSKEKSNDETCIKLYSNI